MAINDKLIVQEEAAGNGGGFKNEEDGLILHLDANDVDSYDGDGTEWVDISSYNINPNTLTEEPSALISATPIISYATNDADSYDGTTTLKNLSSGSYNATLGGATYSADDGTSLSFNNSSNVITTTYSSTGLSAVTWEGWFKLDSVGGQEAIGSFSVNGGNIAIFATHTNTNTPQGYYEYVYVKHADLIGDWVHIAVKFSGWASSYSGYGSGISAKVYVNGSSTGTVTVTPYGHTSAYNTIFRVMGNVTSYKAGGLFSEFRFYHSGLSDADILTNYNHGRVKFYELETANVQLHLDADSFPEKGEAGYSNTPTTWTDSANSYDGTITNATFDSELGNYLEFNGSSNGSVTTTYDIPSSGAKTIEMWFNAASTQTDSYAGLMGGDNEVLWLGGNISGSYSDESIYWYQYSGELGLIIREGEGKYLDNKWHHIAIVDTGSLHKMYVDGEEKSFTYSYGGYRHKITRR